MCAAISGPAAQTANVTGGGAAGGTGVEGGREVWCLYPACNLMFKRVCMCERLLDAHPF